MRTKLSDRVGSIAAVVTSRAALSRCLPTALIVGTLLSVINQGGVVLAGEATGATWIRVLFNYLIPFTVSNIGFVSATLARSRPAQPQPAFQSATPLPATLASVSSAVAFERSLAP